MEPKLHRRLPESPRSPLEPGPRPLREAHTTWGSAATLHSSRPAGQPGRTMLDAVRQEPGRGRAGEAHVPLPQSRGLTRSHTNYGAMAEGGRKGGERTTQTQRGRSAQSTQGSGRTNLSATPPRWPLSRPVLYWERLFLPECAKTIVPRPSHLVL